jgi:predicted nucleic acid-binding protein
MNAYVDTGVLLKIYVLEPDSGPAAHLLESVGYAIAYSHLHELEMFNALHLKRYREEITPRQLAGSLRLIESDHAEGRLFRPNYELAKTFTRATDLAVRYSAKHATRSLDLLHVAIALELGCDQFISFDRRQRRAAQGEKLSILPHRLAT